MKKNNTAEKNILEAEKIVSALKEGTQKTLKQLLSEALEDIIDKDEDDETSTVEDDTQVATDTNDEDTTIQDDSFDVEDVTTDSETETDSKPENGEESSSDSEEDDEWSEYKVGDNDYDLTSVDDDTAFEIFSKIGDSDKVHIQKQDDGTYEINDENSGADLVLDLNPDSKEEDGEEFEIDFDSDSDEDNIELDIVDDKTDTDVDDDTDTDVDDDTEDGEIEIDLGDDSDEDEQLNENDFTGTYQGKDVISGLSMKEPADPKTTDSPEVDGGGVPTGTEQRHAKGNHDKVMTDYEEVKVTKESCKETEQEPDLEEGAARTSVKKSHMVKGNKQKPEGFPAVGPNKQSMNENQIKKILELSKAILEENKKYKDSIQKIKKGLFEAYVTNTNYGRLVNLLMNETTTKEEKRSIVERFKNVKTIKEGKILSESIKRELHTSHKNTTLRLDEQISVNSSKTINETVMFEQTPENNSVLNLMERMDNLPKLNGIKKYKK